MTASNGGDDKTDWQRRREFQTREAVAATLTALGIDVEDAHEMQADMAFLRRVRKLSEDTTTKSVAGTVAAIGAAVMFLLGLGFQKLLGLFQ